MDLREAVEKAQRQRPRDVYEDPKLHKFESVNFDLLVRILHQVMGAERPQFIGALLKLVEILCQADSEWANSSRIESR